MKLVDADALMKALGITDMNCERCAWYSGEDWNPCKRGSDFEQACFMLENAPEAIVRCRDCKYQSKGHNESDEWNTCTYRPWMYIPTDDDNFCSLAKRRTDETD